MVLRLQKSAPNSCGLLSGFRFSLALFASASLNCCALRFVFSLKKPPPCHLPAAATPHARRAHPSAKNFVFASGASISFRRRAQSDLACAASSRSASFPCPLSRFLFFHNFGLRVLASYRLDLIVPESSECSQFS